MRPFSIFIGSQNMFSRINLFGAWIIKRLSHLIKHHSGNICFALDVSESRGWVKWGFILAFWHLKKATPFEEAMVDVLKRDGDTDTNACIVGALLGAFCGIETLPTKWLKRVRLSRQSAKK